MIMNCRSKVLKYDAEFVVTATAFEHLLTYCCIMCIATTGWAKIPHTYAYGLAAIKLLLLYKLCYTVCQ